MQLSQAIKEKVFDNGYNLIDVHFWNGATLVCACVYINDIGAVQGVIAAPEKHDIYNDILFTCQWGAKIRNEIVTRAIFPDLDKTILYWLKVYPLHFPKNFVLPSKNT